MRRALLTLAVTAGMLAGALVSPTAASAGTGGWVYRMYASISCIHPDCGGLGVLPPWVKSLKNPFFVTTDGHGRDYHRASVILQGRPGHPHRCDATAFSRPFTGRCVVHDFGVGMVKASVVPGPRKGLPSFWISSETASFNGGPWVADPFPPYPFDTATPFAPGHYGAEDIFGSSPPGVTFVQNVARAPR